MKAKPNPAGQGTISSYSHLQPPASSLQRVLPTNCCVFFCLFFASRSSGTLLPSLSEEKRCSKRLASTLVRLLKTFGPRGIGPV